MGASDTVRPWGKKAGAPGAYLTGRLDSLNLVSASPAHLNPNIQTRSLGRCRPAKVAVNGTRPRKGTLVKLRRLFFPLVLTPALMLVGQRPAAPQGVHASVETKRDTQIVGDDRTISPANDTSEATAYAKQSSFIGSASVLYEATAIADARLGSLGAYAFVNTGLCCMNKRCGSEQAVFSGCETTETHLPPPQLERL